MRSPRLLVALLVSACVMHSPAAAADYAHPGLLVSTSWLDENLIDPELVVVDLRPAARYTLGHIPNSYNLDPKKLYTSTEERDLLAPDKFEALMESMGIGDGVHVVAVDENGGPAAALLWWCLSYNGFDNASLLDGGYSRWRTEGRAITVDGPVARTAKFTPKPRADKLATLEQIKTWAKRKGAVILDVRHPVVFAGRPGAHSRTGHIPGAVNVPWLEELARDDKGPKFKSADDISAMFVKAGITAQSSVVVYGHNASQAAHAIFALSLTGVNMTASNFAGGFEAWSAHPELPLEQSDKTGSANPLKRLRGKKPGR